MRDDLAIKAKYDQLAEIAKKVMPMIYRTENKRLIKQMMNMMRRFLPKTFFDVTNKYMKNTKSGK